MEISHRAPTIVNRANVFMWLTVVNMVPTFATLTWLHYVVDIDADSWGNEIEARILNR